tara:strand:- start:1791 stop:7190 length:5400 start_codon:yes stop_codon:yes gene_type:complete
MENRNLNNSLFYGNIVKLESNKELFDDILFFVEYIDDTKLILISDTLEKNIFLLNEEGGIDEIEKIIIVHQQEEGYCVINELLPGKLIKINFLNDDSFIQGEIIKLEKDMITVKTQQGESLYIDFEYSGLLDKYNIESIDNIKNYQTFHEGEYEVVEDDTNYEDEINNQTDSTVFTMDQQINDYIEKNKSSSKYKKNIIAEIENYKKLISSYTDLEKGVKIKKMPNNQILYSIFELNPKILNIYSSYLNKELYYNNEIPSEYQLDNVYSDMSKWQYSVVEKDYNSTSKTFSEEDYNTNIIKNNTKTKEYHKKIRLQDKQTAYIINSSLNPETNKPFFFAIKNKGELTTIPYEKVKLDKEEKVIINGLAFKTVSKLSKEINTHSASNLLSKTVQNLNTHYETPEDFKVLSKTKLNKKEIFSDSNVVNYHKFKKEQSFREYVSELNVGLKEVHDKIFDGNEVTHYQFLKKMSIFDIEKLNYQENGFIQKLIRENVSTLKKKINEFRSKLINKSKNSKEYRYIPHEKMYQIIKSVYLSEHILMNTNSAISNNGRIPNNNSNNGNRILSSNTNFTPGELLNISLRDSMDLLLFELRYSNRTINIDLKDEEIKNYLTNLKAKLDGIVPEDEKDKIDYLKFYTTKEEMMMDSNNIVLKNININEDNVERFDPVMFLHAKIINSTKYNKPIEHFIKNLKLILKKKVIDTDDIINDATIFENEEDRSSILVMLIDQILDLKIRKYDKCYIEEEKKFYIYNGDNWVNVEDFNTVLSKKKLIQVKNSIDEFEEIKTKIVNDYAVKYIHMNEIDDDKKDTNYVMRKELLEKKLKQLNKNKSNQLLKYDRKRVLFCKEFEISSGDENLSQYTSILHLILGIEDLDRRYNLIQRFISLFTIDYGDEFWLNCIETKSKLVPKYLQKLSAAYLIYGNYDKVMNEICKNEGHLSENGDMWIHKESGYIIKMLNFDTNYGYDENGFKMKMDTLEGIEDVENDDQIENKESNIDLLVIKETQMDQDEQILTILKSTANVVMNDLYIKLKPLDKNSLIYMKMRDIFKASFLDPKFKHMGISSGIYTILSVLLVYVQTKSILISKPYSTCNLSFSGFPYLEDEMALDGIEYLACYINKRVNPEDKKKKNKTTKSQIIGETARIFKRFSKFEKTESEIKDDLLYYIKQYVLKDKYVIDMIEQRKIFDVKNSSMTYNSPPPSLFKPPLIQIKTSSSYALPKDATYERTHEMLQLVNMKIQQYINEKIKQEEPLLRSYYEEPFLTNFCCNKNDLLLESLISSEEGKKDLSYFIDYSNKLNNILANRQSFYRSGTVIRIPMLLNSEIVEQEETRIYNKESIYSFLIKSLNFDNRQKQVPDYLIDILTKNNFEKPDDSFYDELESKNGYDLKNVIELLQKYGYEFTESFMKEVMHKNHEYNYRLLNNQANDLENVNNSFLSEVEANFNFEFIENEDNENIVDKFSKIQIVLYSKYLDFIEAKLKKQINSSSKKKIINILSQLNNGIYLEKKDNEQFELNIKQLYNINYQLISLVPGLLINKVMKRKNVYTDEVELDENIFVTHFNFAEAHNEDLVKHHESYRNVFTNSSDGIELNEETVDVINNIAKYKSILFNQTLKKNRKEYYSFMLYLLYKVLDIYINLEDSVENVTNINSGIIKIVLEYVKNTSYNYEKMITSHRQSKQSEKAIKTETLRKMSQQQRDAEKYKMSAKLGDWSYGNQSRVFKYYKQFYDQDTEKANEIKEIADQLYSQAITDDVNSSNSANNFENSLTTIIGNEEAEDIAMVAGEDGIVYGENGEELNDYE